MRRRPRGLVPGNVPAALDELGIRYTIRGDEASALCPAHNERSASWSCNTVTGQHNCFSCGFGGSFSWLVAKVLRLDEEDANRWVRKRGGVERARAALRGTETPAQPVRVYTEADLALFVPPPAWALEDRNLTAEAARVYGVLWDHETERWILPIRDPHTGKLWGWQEKGKDFFRNRPYGVVKAETLFGFHLLRPGVRPILVESPLDAPRILSAGIEGAVASFGASVSEAQLQLIVNHRCGLVCALDNDDAGWKRAAWLREHTRRNFRLRYFEYTGTQGKDPGDLDDDAIRRGVSQAFSALVARF